MTEIQTNFRSGDMPGTPKVTATPATIAKSVAPRPSFIAKPVVEESPVADVEVDEEA
jgi:hypothetical protein